MDQSASHAKVAPSGLVVAMGAAAEMAAGREMGPASATWDTRGHYALTA